MKKFLTFFVFVFFAAVFGFTPVHAEEPQGVLVNVELLSGTSNTAHFLGIERDTVILGGNIKGKFTTIRIPKKNFKSIVDADGNDLLIGSAPVATGNPSDSASARPDTLQQVAKDSADIPPTDSTVAKQPSDEADSTISAEAADTAYVPTFLETVEGKHIFVALERRSIDSALAAQLNSTLMQLLTESGTQVAFARRTDFGYCREASCIQDSLRQYKATSVYLGSISAAESQDSITLQVSHHPIDSSNAKPTVAKANLPILKSLSAAMADNRLSNFVKQLQNETLPKPVLKKAYIHVDTDPEGATLTTESKDAICRTPCTFLAPDTGKIVLYTYWRVDKNLWGSRSAVMPSPGDTVKISVKLKQVHPELHVTTIPTGAEIYAGSDPLTVKTKPIGKAPGIYPIYDPGMSTVQIRHPGYRDTSVTVFTPPTGPTNLNIELTPLTTVEEFKAQEAWLKERRKNFIGKTLMGSSIAPILVGTIFTLLAYDNYDDADKIKQELSHPATAGGSHYQQKVDKNHDLVKRGDRKMIIGGSLMGAGVLMLGAGIFLTF